MVKHQLVCNHDEFLIDSYLNRILKTTMELLLKGDIPKTRKKELRRVLVYFQNVRTIGIRGINWRYRVNRNNQHYRMLISVCYLIIEGLLQTTEDTSVKLMHFLDEQRMCRLYEKFILEYYRRHYPQVKTTASQIDWALDDGADAMLPIMQSDVMLTYGDKTLIIDAKYYEHNTQERYGVNTIYSNNLYQMFAYVKNKTATGGEVSGLILYAKTDEKIQPDNNYTMSGNIISVKTLDLDCDFAKVSAQLNEIADHFLHLSPQ